jgi:hypothetical protein
MRTQPGTYTLNSRRKNQSNKSQTLHALVMNLLHRLQQDQASTSHDSGNEVSTEFHHAKVEAGSNHAVNGGSSGGLTRSTSSAWDASHGSGSVVTGLVHKVRAGTLGLGGSLLRCGTLEVASGITVALSQLLLEVGVECKRELLLVAAHTVGTVNALDGIGCDTIAGTLVAADGIKEAFQVAVFDAIRHDAGKALGHTGTELLVRGRWQGRAGLPIVTAGAGSEGSVGRCVRVHLYAGWVDLGNLVREILEVAHLCCLVAIELDQTCFDVSFLTNTH